jgi:hypothetical protein
MRGEELAAARARSPIAPAVAAMMSTLAGLGGDAQHIVAVGDADGNLLWVEGDSDAVDTARGMHLEAGADWSERSAGTNAIGTAVAIDHAVQIFSAEHLVAAVHPWTCSAAPIHDPTTGATIGVIDLTAPLRTAHPHTLALAQALAGVAESTLRLAQMQRWERLRSAWISATDGRRGPSMLVDRDGHVLGARGAGESAPASVQLAGLDGPLSLDDGTVCEAQAIGDDGAILWMRRRRPAPAPAKLELRLLGTGAQARAPDGARETALRSLELLAVLAMHPEGLSAEQLALALYGERGRAVTVRAQVHRLRSRLGEEVLSTQPYRLACSVDADWIAVERELVAGMPGEALRAYPGQLLPQSDAPAIREARSVLDEMLRRAILTTAEPQLLRRWLAHPSGADDLAAARALVATLPPGDPRRAAATATAAAIGRRLAAHGTRTTYG